MVEQGRISELDMSEMPRSRMLLLQEMDQERKKNDYAEFCDNYERKNENLTAEDRKEAFSLTTNVEKMIEMTDHLIKYKNDKNTERR